MQIEIGVILIVLAFLVPIAIFLIVRKVRANRLNKHLGEVFDKEGHENIMIVEDGDQRAITLEAGKSC
jgi:hypothetical protein